ncbi:hypothetical protein [Longimicrobium sp.]|uniref:hypothetical protein n=1 Tax=Longimicrobium sp. TaxID=2029185 RepID=UPI002CBC4EAA|nr:hypothetical protein [Longimicrobium sp.]HSU12495.1 hypothetical protein [Longimicrobium sp.]
MRCWRTSPRLGRWLALIPAAALAACTTADRPPAARPESAPPPPASEAAVARADAAPDCSPPSAQPPAVPDTAFKVTGPAQDWSHVAEFVKANAIAFPDAAGQDSTVVPCSGCAAQRLRIRTESRTQCLTAAMAAASQLRFVGAVVRYAGDVVPAQNKHLGFRDDNATDTVYLLVQANEGYAMFRNRSGKIQFLPYQQQRQGWDFAFNADGMSGASQARWRPETNFSASAGMRTERFAALERGGPAPPADEADAMQTGVVFGWMACAAGCCQFHGSGDGGMGEGHGGHNPGNPPPGPPGPPGPPPGQP